MFLSEWTQRADAARSASGSPVDRVALYGLLMPGLTHEVNNHLTCVVGYSQFAQRGRTDSAGELKTIEEEAIRAARFLREIQDLWRRVDEGPREFDAGELLGQVVSLSRAALRRSGLELSLHPAAARGCALYGHPDVVRDALLALLLNCSCQLEHRARLTLRIEEDEAGLRLDGSIEVDRQETLKPHERPFHAFCNRGEPGQVPLWLADLGRDLAERAGIRVGDVVEEADRIHFAVTLPRARCNGDGEQAEDGSGDGCPRALIAHVCRPTKELRRYLEAEGIRVHLAGDDQSALDCVRRNDFDLLFIELCRKCRKGHAMWARLAQSSPQLAGRTIFLTSAQDYQPTGAESRIGPFLHLPADRDEVRRVVQAQFERAG